MRTPSMQMTCKSRKQTGTPMGRQATATGLETLKMILNMRTRRWKMRTWMRSRQVEQSWGTTLPSSWATALRVSAVCRGHAAACSGEHAIGRQLAYQRACRHTAECTVSQVAVHSAALAARLRRQLQARATHHETRRRQAVVPIAVVLTAGCCLQTQRTGQCWGPQPWARLWAHQLLARLMRARPPSTSAGCSAPAPGWRPWRPRMWGRRTGTSRGRCRRVSSPAMVCRGDGEGMCL